MISYIYGEDDRLITWAQERLGHIRLRSDAKTIGMAVDGAVKAVVAYDTFSVNDCLVHVASDRSGHWVTREYLVRSMAYPFVQCKLRRITCLISADNQRSLTFTRHFGWVEEGRQRKAGLCGEDLILFGMLREECRYLPMMMEGV